MSKREENLLQTHFCKQCWPQMASGPSLDDAGTDEVSLICLVSL